ncbi:sensor histidine kinase [Oleiharenicola lentus]|uniref:sensor histidine kinase n=1 Tax=Oleiharenicola lentus TaxID=2508720 RepID=UPI003F670923
MNAWSFAAAPESAALTTATQVRALAVDEARRALPVRLRGIFMGAADPEGIAFVVQDETEGIYVQGPGEQVAGLVRGDLLEIVGVTDPGGYAPYVVAHTVRKVGHGRIPDPIQVTLDDLNTGQLDARWVEFTGIVRSVELKAPGDLPPPPPGTRYAPAEGPARTGGQKFKMTLAVGGARVVVQIDQDISPADHIGTEVRVRGLCFNLHNSNRQFVRPFVQIPRGVDIVVEKPSPEMSFDGEPQPVASLLQFAQLSGDRGQRVHVRGTVVHHELGTALWIRDHDRGLRVETTQRHPLHPGDEVDVVGFPALGEYSPIIEDAVFRRRGAGPAPAPQQLDKAARVPQHDADLVQLQARLNDVRLFADSVALVLDWQGTSVRVRMHLAEKDSVPLAWQPGSIVQVSGICTVVADTGSPLGGLWDPRSFQLLLRSPADLAVIQPPPWWSPSRIVYVLSGFLALAIGAAAVVMFVSRRRLREQEHRRAMAETEFTAILSERNRLAREIHDTLSQSLGAISVQLELTRAHADGISPPARQLLASAHKLTRAALTEARDSIWNMRSHVLEKGDLAEALRGILQQLTDGTGVTPRFQTEGLRRRLPPTIENNLLRIGQEAITNACKHARPSCIEVKLAFEARSAHLMVKDDGVGFVREVRTNASQRSFGLVGIVERAELLGGTAAITSVPGEGTRVVVNVPA